MGAFAPGCPRPEEAAAGAPAGRQKGQVVGGGGEGKGGVPGGAGFPQIERANNRDRAKSSSQEMPTASGTRVGLDWDPGWGQRGFAAAAKGPALESPQ